MSILSRKIGIDLGTSTVLIYVKGEGIVVNEPSLAAVNRDRTRILAVGNQAFAWWGALPNRSRWCDRCATARSRISS